MVATTETIAAVEDATGSYKYGFVTDIETEKAPKGLNEDVIRFISVKKDEPEWMNGNLFPSERELQMGGGVMSIGKPESCSQ